MHINIIALKLKKIKIFFNFFYKYKNRAGFSHSINYFCKSNSQKEIRHAVIFITKLQNIVYYKNLFY